MRYFAFLIFLTLIVRFTNAQTADTLKISGEKHLCETIQLVFKDFQLLNPNCNLKIISAENTSLAIAEFIDQSVSVALTTREIAERDKKNISFEYNQQVFAKDALVFYINSKTNIKALSAEDILKVYTGQITNWKELGGKDEKIYLMAQPHTSDISTYLRIKVLNQEFPAIDASITNNITATQTQLLKFSGAIAYTQYNQKISKAQLCGIKNNSGVIISPVEENIVADKYPLSYNNYCMVNKKDKNAIAFLEWLQQANTKKLLKNYGLL